MKRRDFLATAGAATLGTLAAPRLSLAQNDARVLRFVPQANLSSLDAVAGTQYVVRNAALMIWDTLYGIDSHIDPKPQMAEGHEVSPDFKIWTFKLRSGLKFHDGSPCCRATSPPASPAGWSATRWASGSRPRSTRWRRRTTARSPSASTSRFPRCCSRWARTTRRWPSSCRSGSPRPTPSSSSPNTSAPARCRSTRANGFPAARPCSSASPATSPGRRRPTGSPAASA